MQEEDITYQEIRRHPSPPSDHTRRLEAARRGRPHIADDDLLDMDGYPGLGFPPSYSPRRIALRLENEMARHQERERDRRISLDSLPPNHPQRLALERANGIAHLQERQRDRTTSLAFLPRNHPQRPAIERAIEMKRHQQRERDRTISQVIEMEQEDRREEAERVTNEIARSHVRAWYGLIRQTTEEMYEQGRQEEVERVTNIMTRLHEREWNLEEEDRDHLSDINHFFDLSFLPSNHPQRLALERSDETTRNYERDLDRLIDQIMQEMDEANRR
ncbi:MAG: hypothetical protein Q9228_006175 [Teloschistes exilis]